MAAAAARPLIALTAAPFILPVSIEAVQVTALIDTGAQASFVSLDVTRLLELPVDRSHQLNVVGVQNVTVNSLGTCRDIPLLLRDSQNNPLSLVLSEAIVLETCPFSLVLGLPFLQEHEFVLDPKRYLLRVSDRVFLSKGVLRNRLPQYAAATAQLVERVLTDKDGVGRATSNVTIPPFSGALVTVECSANPSGETVFVEPVAMSQGRLFVPEGVHRGTRFKVLVINGASVPQTVRQNTTLVRTIPLYGDPLAPVLDRSVACSPPVVAAAAAAIPSDPSCDTKSSLISELLTRLDNDIPTHILPAFQALLEEFVDVFVNDFSTDSFQSETSVTIALQPGAVPKRQRFYRLPESQIKTLRVLLDRYLRESVIEPSSSSWSSPAFFVPKANGKLRLVVDYRYLNSQTIPNGWPLPRIEDLLDRLHGSVLFSTFDAHSGFHQLPIAPESRYLTAFTTPLGLYQFKRMPMGLINAPADFSRAMDAMCRDMPNALVYVDDITIFSRLHPDDRNLGVSTYQAHLNQVRTFLITCRQHGLKLNAEKCCFARTRVAFLGHVISAAGVTPDPDKVARVRSFLVPSNPMELKSFLGLVNYYRAWIRDAAARQLHLTALLTQGASYNWTAECDHEFRDLREALTVECVRHYPEPDVPFILFTDASDYALGCVLAQRDRSEDREVVIAYHSRQFTAAECRYPTTQKEALAIVEGCRHFRPYLLSGAFTVYTDHRALHTVLAWPNPPPRILRWLMVLQEFTFTCVYRKGALNLNADALSRLQTDTISARFPSYAQGQFVSRFGVLEAEASFERNFFDVEVTALPGLLPALQDSQVQLIGKRFRRPSDGRPYEIVDVFVDPNGGDIHGKLQVLDSSVNPFVDAENAFPIAELRQFVQDFPVEVERISPMDAYKFTVDATFARLAREEVEQLAAAHPPAIDLAAVYEIPDPSGGFALLYRSKANSKTGQVHHQLILPSNHAVVEIFMAEAHRDAGHSGVTKTLEHLASRVYFYRMANRVTDFVRCCDVCQHRGNRADQRFHAPIGSHPMVCRPFQRVSIDLIGPLPTSEAGNKYIAVVVDHFTKWVIADSLEDKSAVVVADFLLRHVYLRYGIPEAVLSDNGTEFVNELQSWICSQLDINHVKATAYHPQSNGQVERINSILIEGISKFTSDRTHRNWDQYLAAVVFANNTSVSGTTGYTPYFLLHGCEARTWIDHVLPAVSPKQLEQPYQRYAESLMGVLSAARDNAVRNIHRTQAAYNLPGTVQRTLQREPFNVGEEVLVYTPVARINTTRKLAKGWRGPYRIVKKVSDLVYRVKIGTTIKPYHISRLKPYWRATPTGSQM